MIPTKLRCFFMLFMCFTVLTSLYGCTQTRITFDEPPITRPYRPAKMIPKPQAVAPKPVDTNTLLSQADDAWRLDDMTKAEELYTSLQKAPNLTEDQYRTVFSRLNASALANNKPDLAKDALHSWSITKPDIQKEPEWIYAWGDTLLKLPDDSALQSARSVTSDIMASPALRAEAYGVLLVKGKQDDQFMNTEYLSELYNTADHSQKVIMEQGLLKLVQSYPTETLGNILQYTDVDTDKSFPWSILLLEKARRENLSGQSQTYTAERISEPGVFADESLMQTTLNSVEEKVEEASENAILPPQSSPVELYPTTTALVLPLSGKYASIGKKIMAGAEAGRADLNSTGVKTAVFFIDTEKPNWVGRVSELPAECLIIGGPMLPTSYKEAKTAHLTDNRVFFTFLSNLDDGDEGNVAWRFFTSTKDQVDAVLKYANQAGVRKVAILYPNESYGQKMKNLFMAEHPVYMKYSSTPESASYPPSNISAWNNVISRLVGGGMIGKVPTSHADFDGIFIPDTWDKASILIPHLFFNGEDRLLILGSALWGQGLKKGLQLDASNVRTAVYPSAWNSGSLPSSAKRLKKLLGKDMSADFWTGLGYDFVRFAAALQLGNFKDSQKVNYQLASASKINWSIAPISWDSDGIASQHMFILNPVAGGSRYVSPESMSGRLATARHRYDRRVAAAIEKNRVKSQKNSQTKTADAQSSSKSKKKSSSSTSRQQ